jgi:hypothetical protein
MFQKIPQSDVYREEIIFFVRHWYEKSSMSIDNNEKNLENLLMYGRRWPSQGLRQISDNC